jgi:copper chaperone CopZ
MAAVKVTARLENLSCPSCADMITNVLGKVKGVKEVEVRYTTSKLLVTYDDEITTWEELQDKVTKLGYGIASKSQRRD